MFLCMICLSSGHFLYHFFPACVLSRVSPLLCSEQCLQWAFLPKYGCVTDERHLALIYGFGAGIVNFCSCSSLFSHYFTLLTSFASALIIVDCFQQQLYCMLFLLCFLSWFYCFLILSLFYFIYPWNVFRIIVFGSMPIQPGKKLGVGFPSECCCIKSASVSCRVLPSRTWPTSNSGNSGRPMSGVWRAVLRLLPKDNASPFSRYPPPSGPVENLRLPMSQLERGIN